MVSSHQRLKLQIGFETTIMKGKTSEDINAIRSGIDVNISKYKISVANAVYIKLLKSTYLQGTTALRNSTIFLASSFLT